MFVASAGLYSRVGNVLSHTGTTHIGSTRMYGHSQGSHRIEGRHYRYKVTTGTQPAYRVTPKGPIALRVTILFACWRLYGFG